MHTVRGIKVVDAYGRRDKQNLRRKRGDRALHPLSCGVIKQPSIPSVLKPSKSTHAAIGANKAIERDRRKYSQQHYFQRCHDVSMPVLVSGVMKPLYI